MCRGFGAIVDKDLNVYFTSGDTSLNIHHSDILRALGWKENSDSFIRNFVRIECPDWKITSFVFDEQSTLPAFASENEEEIKNKVNKILLKVEESVTKNLEKSTKKLKDIEKKREELLKKRSDDLCDLESTYEDTCKLLWDSYQERCKTLSENQIPIYYRNLQKKLVKEGTKFSEKRSKIYLKYDKIFNANFQVRYNTMEMYKKDFDKTLYSIPGYVGEK